MVVSTGRKMDGLLADQWVVYLVVSKAVKLVLMLVLLVVVLLVAQLV